MAACRRAAASWVAVGRRLSSSNAVVGGLERRRRGRAATAARRITAAKYETRVAGSAGSFATTVSMLAFKQRSGFWVLGRHQRSSVDCASLAARLYALSYVTIPAWLDLLVPYSRQLREH